MNEHFGDIFSDFVIILKIYVVNVALVSHDSRETFVRVSHDVSTNVAYFHLHLKYSGETFVKYECRKVLICFPKNLSLIRSCEIRASTSKTSHFKFNNISRRQVRDASMNVVRMSLDSLAKYFGNIL